MTGNAYNELVQVSDAQYQVLAGMYQAIVASENELRRSLKRLQAQRKGAFSSGECQFDASRIGADVAWQAWLGKRIADLNTELARLLVKKATLHQKFSHAHGKLLAAQEARASVVENTRVRKNSSDAQYLSHVMICRELQPPRTGQDF